MGNCFKRDQEYISLLEVGLGRTGIGEIGTGKIDLEGMALRETGLGELGQGCIVGRGSVYELDRQTKCHRT